MSNYTAGKEVISYCGKCKLSLGHIIVSMKDENTIGKVVCNTCKATHAYKDPAAKTKKAKSAKKTTASKTRKTKSVTVNELWTEQLRKTKEKPQSYSIRETFVKGDLLDHKTFGPGIVQELIDGKIEVLFQHEMKILVHGK